MIAEPLRVLLVEDDEEDYMITRDLFEEIPDHRYNIEWIDTYESALPVILEQRHDVYMLDYHLGARDGLELLSEALAAGCRAPMIMLTGQGGRQVDLEAMRLGAYDYLVKGHITPQMLERAIRYALEHAKSTEALREMVRVSSSLLTIVNHMKRGVAITDPLLDDNPIIYANDQYLALTGYGRDELVGRNPRLLQGPETDPAEVAVMRRAVEQGAQYKGQLLNYKKDGTPIEVELEFYPIHNKQGGTAQYVSILRAVGIPLVD